MGVFSKLIKAKDSPNFYVFSKYILTMYIYKLFLGVTSSIWTESQGNGEHKLCVKFMTRPTWSCDATFIKKIHAQKSGSL